MNLFYAYASSIQSLITGTGLLGKPSTLAFALSNGPTTNVTCTEIPDSGGYYRPVLAPNSAGVPFSGINANWSFPTVVSGYTYNNVQINFPQCVTQGWGNISGIFVCDNQGYGSGNVLFYGQLPIMKDIEPLDQLYIPISGVQLRFW